ncbi:molybdopterin-binding protein [Caldiplasma sukawensis]
MSIGNEVVKGRTVNSNATEISSFFTERGHYIRKIVSCRDIKEEICDAIYFCLKDSQAVITTGGLGPTHDDITAEAIAETFNLKITENKDAIKILKELYLRRNMEITEERKKMGMLPEGAMIIENDVGTAPGFLIKIGGKFIFSTPGVPSEMRSMLNKIYGVIGESDLYYMSKEILIKGIMESAIAPLIREINKKFPELFIKSHPEAKEFKNPILKLEIYGYFDNKEKAEEQINEIKGILKSRLSGLNNAEIKDI